MLCINPMKSNHTVCSLILKPPKQLLRSQQKLTLPLRLLIIICSGIGRRMSITRRLLLLPQSISKTRQMSVKSRSSVARLVRNGSRRKSLGRQQRFGRGCALCMLISISITIRSSEAGRSQAFFRKARGILGRGIAHNTPGHITTSCGRSRCTGRPTRCFTSSAIKSQKTAGFRTVVRSRPVRGSWRGTGTTVAIRPCSLTAVRTHECTPAGQFA